MLSSNSTYTRTCRPLTMPKGAANNFSARRRGLIVDADIIICILLAKKSSAKCQGKQNLCLVYDNIFFDKNIIAENFNCFYTTVASKRVEKLPACVKKIKKNYSDKCVFANSYSLPLVSENKVFK